MSVIGGAVAGVDVAGLAGAGVGAAAGGIVWPMDVGASVGEGVELSDVVVGIVAVGP